MLLTILRGGLQSAAAALQKQSAQAVAGKTEIIGGVEAIEMIWEHDHTGRRPALTKFTERDKEDVRLR